MNTDKSANLRDATKSFIVTGDGNVFNVQFTETNTTDNKQPIDDPKFWRKHTLFNFGRIFIILFCLAISASLIMFFIKKNYVFSTAGVPVKCYASTPGGYEEVPCNWEVHRIFGTPVICDPEKIRAVVTSGWMAKQDKPLTSKKVIPTADIAFFSPGGEPILWYYQHPDGKLDFFAQPGFHPQLRVILSPVNSEIAALAMRYLQEGKGNKIGANIGTSVQKTSEQAKPDSANALDGLEQLRKNAE